MKQTLIFVDKYVVALEIANDEVQSYTWIPVSSPESASEAVSQLQRMKELEEQVA